MNLSPRYLVLEAYNDLANSCRVCASCICQLLPLLPLKAETFRTAESLCAGFLLTHNGISQVLEQSRLASESWLLLRLEALDESLANKLFVLQRFTKRLCEEAERANLPPKFLPALALAQSGLNVLGFLRLAQDSTEACKKSLTTTDS